MEGVCGRAGGVWWEAVNGDVRSAGSGGDVSAPTSRPAHHPAASQFCAAMAKPSAKSRYFQNKKICLHYKIFYIFYSDINCKLRKYRILKGNCRWCDHIKKLAVNVLKFVFCTRTLTQCSGTYISPSRPQHD